MGPLWTCRWCSPKFTSVDKIKSHLDAQILQPDELHKPYKNDIIDFRHAQEKWQEGNSQFLLRQPSRRLVNLSVNLD